MSLLALSDGCFVPELVQGRKIEAAGSGWQHLHRTAVEGGRLGHHRRPRQQHIPLRQLQKHLEAVAQ